MIQPLRSGRLSCEERNIILDELGKIAIARFNRNLFFGGLGKYALGKFKNALKYAPDIQEFENAYWVDTGKDKLNEIFDYFEYGTGLYNTRFAKKLITAKKGKVMAWKGKGGNWQFAKSQRGVKPVFAFKRTVMSMDHDRKHLQRKIRLRLGI